MVDFYGMYVTAVDAGEAGITDILVFFGVVVRCCYYSRVIVFGDEPQDPAAVAAAVSYECLGAHLVCRTVNQAFIFCFLEYLLCLFLCNLSA